MNMAFTVKRNKHHESEKWKSYKSKAIHRARDLKQWDGRGKEAEVNMEDEIFNSNLSSRVACPFEIRRVCTEIKHKVDFDGTRHVIRPVKVEHEQVLIRGVLYEGKTNITVIHEVDQHPLYYVEPNNHICFQDMFDYPCEYKIVMKKLKQISISRIDV